MIRSAVLFFIKGYSFLISPLLGRNCRYHPTCSAYMIEAVEKHGVAKGLVLGVRRLLSCHPYCHKPYEDPVPQQVAWRDFFRYKKRQITAINNPVDPKTQSIQNRQE